MLLPPIHLQSLSLSNVRRMDDNVSNCYVTLCTYPCIVPTPTVTLNQDASSLLYEGSAVTLTCTATLHPSVDTDVNLTAQWTPAISRNRVATSPPSSSRYPFTSTLAISPLAITDAGQYNCEVIAYSSSPYIIASEPGVSPRLNLTVQSVEQNMNDTGKTCLLQFLCLFNLYSFSYHHT